MTSRGTVRTGTAGWVYAPWRGTFFPPGLVQKNELAYAARHLGSIEINATFRANQKPESFARWAAETPPGFKFSLKGPQLVTHIKRLRDCSGALAAFFASGPLALGDRLGPFIWQLPPNLAFDYDSLVAFLALLPRDLDAYRALASTATGGKAPPFLDADGVTTIRHAIEPRHPSFDAPQITELLARHNVARVVTDTHDHPDRARTADFAYCRLQGPPRPGADHYGPGDIADIATTIAAWRDAGGPVEKWEPKKK